jgi:hypothetical protein
MKKSVKLACHVVNSNITIDSLPSFQISLGNVALFEKIYDGEPILTVFSNIGVSQPNTKPILENNSCLELIETGFT